MPISELERRRAFLEAVNAICRAANGVLVENTRRTKWEINTPAGKLHVCPIIDSEAPWIACRFLEPGRVVARAEGADCQSGQWDFHLWSEWSRTTNPQWEPAHSHGMAYFETALENLLARRAERGLDQAECNDRAVW